MINCKFLTENKNANYKNRIKYIEILTYDEYCGLLLTQSEMLIFHFILIKIKTKKKKKKQNNFKNC